MAGTQSPQSIPLPAPPTALQAYETAVRASTALYDEEIARLGEVVDAANRSARDTQRLAAELANRARKQHLDRIIDAERKLHAADDDTREDVRAIKSLLGKLPSVKWFHDIDAMLERHDKGLFVLQHEAEITKARAVKAPEGSGLGGSKRKGR
jgi:hypothetical protein